MLMVKGTLKNGFEYEVDLDKMRSMRFIDALAELEENPLAMSKIVLMAFGSDQREKLYTHIEKTGVEVSTEIMSDIIGEVFDNHAEIKN